MTTLLEEISQQPAALTALRKYYSSPGAIPTKALRALVRHWPPTVVFTGMGSSLYAAYPAQAYLSEQGIRAVLWETAELVHHHMKALRPDTLLVIVSQSGETVEALRLLEQLPSTVRVLAVANVEASPLAKQAKLTLPMMAGGQEAVSTKTYLCSVAVLMYLAFAIAGKPPRPLTQEVLRAAEAVERILDRHEVLIPPLLEFLNHPPYVTLMSRGPDLATVFQGALMLKEVVRLAAEPTSAAQFRHGPIEIVSPSHRYILVARQGKTAKLLVKLSRDIGKLGGRVLLLADKESKEEPNVLPVRVEPLKLGLGTLVDSVYIQLLAHDAALEAGLKPGQFEVATNVTREE
jgi:glucosamine--fructose-6-phosphate aminotransferase (isomerizing)